MHNISMYKRDAHCHYLSVNLIIARLSPIGLPAGWLTLSDGEHKPLRGWGTPEDVPKCRCDGEKGYSSPKFLRKVSTFLLKVGKILHVKGKFVSGPKKLSNLKFCPKLPGTGHEGERTLG